MVVSMITRVGSKIDEIADGTQKDPSTAESLEITSSIRWVDENHNLLLFQAQFLHLLLHVALVHKISTSMAGWVRKGIRSSRMSHVRKHSAAIMVLSLYASVLVLMTKTRKAVSVVFVH